jgi:hypothetical protein
MQHTQRVAYDETISSGRECAPFMQRGVRYFSNLGVELMQDCNQPDHAYPAHCASCKRGGFGITTLGEDSISSIAIIKTLALWVLVDSVIALFMLVHAYRQDNI